MCFCAYCHRTNGQPSSKSLTVDSMNLTSHMIAQLVKNPLEMQETPVLFLGHEDPLEKG